MFFVYFFSLTDSEVSGFHFLSGVQPVWVTVWCFNRRVKSELNHLLNYGCVQYQQLTPIHTYKHHMEVMQATGNKHEWKQQRLHADSKPQIYSNGCFDFHQVRIFRDGHHTCILYINWQILWSQVRLTVLTGPEWISVFLFHHFESRFPGLSFFYYFSRQN